MVMFVQVFQLPFNLIEPSEKVFYFTYPSITKHVFYQTSVTDSLYQILALDKTEISYVFNIDVIVHTDYGFLK